MEILPLLLTIRSSLDILLMVALVVILVYGIKLLIATTSLVKNLNEVTLVVKKDLEPLIMELTETLTNLNTFADNTDRQINKVKKVVEKIALVSGLFMGKFKFLSSGFLKGVQTGFNVFFKK